MKDGKELGKLEGCHLGEDQVQDTGKMEGIRHTGEIWGTPE